MAAQHLVHAGVAGGDFQLGDDGIGLDVDPHGRGQVDVLAQRDRADDVEQRVAAGVQLVELRGGHPPAGALAVAEPERPPVGEPDRLHAARDVRGGVRAVVGQRFGLRVIRPDVVVLDVVDVVAEARQAAQPVQIEPGLPRERDAAHHPQHDELQRPSCRSSPAERPSPRDRALVGAARPSPRSAPG